MEILILKINSNDFNSFKIIYHCVQYVINYTDIKKNMFGLRVNFVLFGEEFWTVSVKFLKTFHKFTAGGAVEKRKYLDDIPEKT